MSVSRCLHCLKSHLSCLYKNHNKIENIILKLWFTGIQLFYYANTKKNKECNRAKNIQEKSIEWFERNEERSASWRLCWSKAPVWQTVYQESLSPSVAATWMLFPRQRVQTLCSWHEVSLLVMYIIIIIIITILYHFNFDIQ